MKNQAFRSKTLDFDCETRYFKSKALKYYNPVQNIRNNAEKSSKIGQDKKKLPKFNLWSEDSRLGNVSTQTWDFPNIS